MRLTCALVSSRWDLNCPDFGALASRNRIAPLRVFGPAPERDPGSPVHGPRRRLYRPHLTFTHSFFGGVRQDVNFSFLPWGGASMGWAFP